MPQWTKVSPSQKANTQAVTDVDKVPPPSKSTSKPLPVQIEDGEHPEKSLVRCEGKGEKAAERPDTPCRAPQTWESELPDFDWTASPGAEEWQSGETADGCAVYSVASGVGAGVTVEFQKWDW